MKVKVRLSQTGGETMFIPENGQVYWKGWFRSIFHILRLLHQGHIVEYEE